MFSILVIAWSAMIASSFAAGPPIFFFYYPDSPQNNLGRLKQEVEQFFSSQSFPILFQPVAQISDLNNQIREQHPAFTLVPQWYFDENGKQMQMVPFLSAQCNKSDIYTKILLTRNTSGQPQKQSDARTLALTTMGPGSDKRIKSMLFMHGGLEGNQLDIIVVPKDTDALLALALGQVDIALVTDYTLNQVSSQNPRLGASVTVMPGALPVPMPVLCYTKGVASGQEVQTMKQLLAGRDAFQKSPQLKTMLQIDDWKLLPAAE